ncbi:unnamed protein product [Protopolystoma xenopodis]|uniref:EF-hand domain-containing protein n=1 Tax=Protopolystoma xenopodis TaxID=117903 RepID=A0A3S5B5U4_9PLAT|nr:unnamed protein product [Protopolystoma xenopodis]
MEFKPITEYPDLTGHTIWTRKMRTLFRRLDSNGHGYVCVDDILEVITQMMGTFPKMATWRSDEVVQALIDFWYSCLCPMGEEHARTTAHLNENAFVTNLERSMKVGGILRDRFDQILVHPLFHSADGDEDNLINLTEFASLMKALKSPDRDADLVAKIADTEKNGKLTEAQFHGILADFFASEDPKSKYLKLWGNLVNYKRPEDYGTIECGPMWEGKMRTMFRRLDINRSGRLRCHNLLQIGRSIAQRNHLDRRRSDAVMRAMLTIWVKFIALDKEGEQYQ